MTRSIQIESSRDAAEADLRHHTRQRLEYAENTITALRQKLQDIFYDLAEGKSVTMVMGTQRVTAVPGKPDAPKTAM